MGLQDNQRGGLHSCGPHSRLVTAERDGYFVILPVTEAEPW